MCVSLRGLGWAAIVVCGGVWPAVGQAQLSGPASGDGPVRRGQQLFEKVWGTRDSLAAPTGDGLGPLYNEKSCIACHFMGGIGGAGPSQNNVELIAVDVSPKLQKASELRGRLVKLHPAFADGPSIVLHRYGTDPHYETFREKLLGSKPLFARKSKAGYLNWVQVQGASLVLAERNTTPLFGLGLIDSIPAEEIAKVAAQQAKDTPYAQGRIAGRFGWRGQAQTLDLFVRGACAVELGLQVSTNAQAADPLAKSTLIQAAKKLKATGPPRAANGLVEHVDLTDQQCADLTTFIATLPAPRQLDAVNSEAATEVNQGKRAFMAVGCGVCHQPTLAHVSGIYSDLLLHDMGPSLIDPVPATSAATNQYYGGQTGFAPPSDLVIKGRREWKTPPLWGLRDSAPYLHDGRAETIDEAIAHHGGQASGSVGRYLELSSGERARVLKFLASLAAPDPLSLPKLMGSTNRHVDAGVVESVHQASLTISQQGKP